jgi:hypothetical protein
MLARKRDPRGSKFIREEAGTDHTYSASGNQSSRMKWSATPVAPTGETHFFLWDAGCTI